MIDLIPEFTVYLFVLIVIVCFVSLIMQYIFAWTESIKEMPKDDPGLAAYKVATRPKRKLKELD